MSGPSISTLSVSDALAHDSEQPMETRSSSDSVARNLTQSISTLSVSDALPGRNVSSTSISTLSVSDAMPSDYVVLSDNRTQRCIRTNSGREQHEHDDGRSRSESDTEQANRLERIRQRQIEARERSSQESRLRTLENDRLRHSRSRQESSQEQNEARLERERSHQHEIRSREDADERAAGNLRESQARRRRNAAIGLDLNGIGFEYDPAIDYREHHLLQTGRMDIMCSYCHALRYISEPPGMCCVSGKVSIAALEPPDDIAIQELFFGDYPEARAFITDIRKYNGVFQMTSFGANIIRPDGYNPTFKIQGQVYHRIGPLLPSPGELPTYLQIYFMGDAAMQIERRTGLYEGMRPNIVGIFQALLDRSNRLIEIFRTNIDRLPSENHQIVIRADRRPAGEHERRFNAPLNDEVAILFVEGQQPHRDVAVRRRSGGLMRINELHPSYDALQYPLILWRGNDTYHPNIAQINPATGEPTQKRVSPSD